MRILLGSVGLMVAAAQAGELPAGVVTKAGTDAGSGITYALLSVNGRWAGEGVGAGGAPRLTAQCTKTAAGKLKFEVLADLRPGLQGAGPEDGAVFYPPWKASAGELYPPRLEKAQVTMEFLGYTKVKPVKRVWEYLLEDPNEMKYANPGMGSANLEEIAFYMRYLRSLPTLRLTVPGKGAAEWETTKWQAAIHAEPVCGASGV